MSTAIADRAGGFKPRVGVILGSGFGGFADEVEAVASIPYAELEGFPQPTVGGHAGRVVLGRVGPTTAHSRMRRWPAATIAAMAPASAQSPCG